MKFERKKFNKLSAAKVTEGNSGASGSSNAVKETYNIGDLLFENHISRTYNFNFDLYQADKEKSFEVIDKLKLTKSTFKIDLSSRTHYYEGISESGSELMIILEELDNKSEMDISILAQDLPTLSYVHDMLFEKAVKDFISKTEVSILFSDFSIAGSQISEKTTRMKADTFNSISDKYYPFIDMDIFMNEFLTRQENLLVLTGDTGTGKTKFGSLILKYAIKQYHLLENLVKNSLDEEDREDYEIEEEELKEIKVAYLKNEDILAADQFWTMIKNKRFDFIILDDLDYMLIPRNREVSSEVDINRSKFISQLLSFTDGIVPTTTKFIITSNKSDKDVDSALMRPGRMFDILSFRRLTYNEALEIWLDFDLEDSINKFEEAFQDKEEITHAELGSLLYQTRLKSDRKSYFKNQENLSLTKDSIELNETVVGFKSKNN